MTLPKKVLHSFIAGTLASLAMMPLGTLFRALELRIGHYGPKFASLFVDDPSRLFLFGQHMVIGWVSAFPLVLYLAGSERKLSAFSAGGIYGALYYLVLNFTALPLYFGDPLPIQLGIATVLPSLVAHIIFGLVIGGYWRWVVGGAQRSS